MKQYDLAVIGAGSGGLAAAKTAAKLGADVALITNTEIIGGTALHNGCIPSKALIYAARQPEVSWQRCRQAMQLAVERVKDDRATSTSLEQLGIDLLMGEAAFRGRRLLTVEGVDVSAKKIIIATGSQPKIPDIPGLGRAAFYTNETIFQLSELPQHIAIIGGGPVAAELGFAFVRLGARVSIIDHNPKILSHVDDDAVDQVVERLQRYGVGIYTSAKITKIADKENTLKLRFRQNGKAYTLEPDVLMVAAGREAVIPEGCDTATIRTDKQGILVNKNWRTSNRHVYAIGDCIHMSHRSTHNAMAAGHQAALHALYAIPTTQVHHPLYAYFTEPEIAHIGYNESQLRWHNIDYQVWSKDYSQIDKTAATNQEGSIKVLTDRRGKMLGATVTGHHASELIGLLADALHRGRKLSSLATINLPYPTLGTGIKQLALEAEIDKFEQFSSWLRLLSRVRI